MSNREFPGPPRPDPRWDGRLSGAPAGRGDRLLPGPRSAADGYAKASGTGGRGRGVDELDGYGRGSGGRTGGSGRGGQHARGGVRDSDEKPSRRGSADAGRGENGYTPRRAKSGAPDTGRPDGPRDAARFGTGRRVKDDLRERLRRNGIGTGDWDGADGPRGRPGGNGTREDGWDDSMAGRLRGRFSRNAAGGADDWDGTDSRPLRRFRRKGAGGGDFDGPDGRPPRRKGSWWRHWSWKKVLGIVAAAFGALMIAGAAGVAYAYSKATIPPIQTAVFVQASKVYFSDGKTLVGQFGDTNRVILNYNQIPAVLRSAVVAAEDKNFWHEGGISPTGIIRAAYYDLTSSGGNLQGASTITQQLVRNYYNNVGTAQTMSRKIKEIFVAQKLAQAKSKEWILQQYLNTIYLGNRAYGVAAAAQVYFGLAANQISKITPAQAAMIAAMIQQPSGYSPDPKAGAAYQGLVYRWHYVINAMVGMGALSQQAASAAKFPTVVKPMNNTWNGYYGYIMQAVQNELETTYHYSPTKIATGGLHVVTTFKKNLMDSLYSAVRTNERLMRNCTPSPLLAGAATAACTKLPHYVRVGAVLEQPGTGAILAMYSGPSFNRKGCNCKFDNALLSRNQVGSSFKPYVLATAVHQGMNVQSSVLNGDSPLWIPPDSLPTTDAKTGSQPPAGGGYFQVSNDESGNNNLGPVTVVHATAASLNTAYTDLWHRVAKNPDTGAYNVVNMAKAFGVDSTASGLWTMRDEAGTALGQASLTVEEQATTIATLADNGTYSTPHVIQQITDGSQVIPARVVHRQVLTPAEAADVNWAMSQDTAPGGTAAGLGLTNGQTVIAKTGTTNLSQSAFFMGATPKDAMAIGMFVNHPGCTLPKSQQYKCTSTSALAYAPPPGLETLFGVGGLSGYGGQYPALIWHTFFMDNFNSLALVPFPPVNGDGTKWNLFGQLPKKKSKDKSSQQNGGSPGCQGQGPPFPARGHCKHNFPQPTSTPTATPTATPTVTPTTTPTGHPHFGTRAATSGGGGVGALALAAVMVAGPLLSVLGRLRRRRTLRRTERPPAG